MGYESWHDVAILRASRIIARERVMSQYMLESKISEAGPVDKDPPPSKTNQRAHPPHITAALRHLVAGGDIRPLPRADAAALGLTDRSTSLFLDSTFDPARGSDKDRLQRVVAGYSDFLAAINNTALCGKVLENTVHAASLAARHITVIGDPDRPPRIPINGIAMPTSPPDHVLAVGSDLILVEDKNRREWIYPHRSEVWTLIRRCLEADRALPILITRKVPPKLLAFFQRIGALAFQTNNQIFAASVAPFESVRSKQGLNFHDIRFADTPQVVALQDRLRRFFEHTVPRLVSERRATFRIAAPILEFFLAQAGGDPGRITSEACDECMTALDSGQLPSDDDYLHDDPSDYA